MAIYHLTLTHRSRQDGYSALERARYVARLGRYEERADLVHVESANFPAWVAAHDREGLAYWSAADEHERANGRLYSEYEASLPRELGRDDQIQMARLLAEHVATAREGRLPVTWAVHDGGTGNPHVHIVRSDRALDGFDRTPETWFARASTGKKTRNEGGAKKARSVMEKSHLEDARAWWADLQNSMLARAGHGARVDHRTLAAQGIDREPTVHLGRTASAWMRAGRASNLNTETQRRIAHNRLVAAQAEVEHFESELSSTYAEWLEEMRQTAQQTNQQAGQRAAVEPAFTKRTTEDAAKKEAARNDYRPTYRAKFAPPAARRVGTLGRASPLDSLRSLPGGDVAHHERGRAEELLSGDARRDLVPQRAASSDRLRRTAPPSDRSWLVGRGVSHLEDLVAQLLANAAAPSIVGVAFVVPSVPAYRLTPRPDVSYEAKQGRAGMMYIRRPDDVFALFDRGDRVTVAHVDTDTVRAALALAASKWKVLELTGDIEYRRQAVRQAVRMGLGDRLARLSPELESVRRDEAARLTAGRARSAAAALTPARAPDSGIATPMRSVPRRRYRRT